MFQIVTVCFLIAFTSTYGHNGGTFRDDANMQVELMPQELNPEFISQQQNDPNKVYADLLQIPMMPRRPLLPPKVRVRRDVTAADSAIVEPYATSIAEQVKQYSRIIAGFVLVISLAIEIVVYIIEAYQTDGA